MFSLSLYCSFAFFPFSWWISPFIWGGVRRVVYELEFIFYELGAYEIFFFFLNNERIKKWVSASLPFLFYLFSFKEKNYGKIFTCEPCCSLDVCVTRWGAGWEELNAIFERNQIKYRFFILVQSFIYLPGALSYMWCMVVI